MTAGQNRTQSIHDYVVAWHELKVAPYVVRKTDFAITRSEKYDGSVLYARSNFINGQWSTVMVSSKTRDVPLLNAVASSITVGVGQPLWFKENGLVPRKTKGYVGRSTAQ